MSFGYKGISAKVSRTQLVERKERPPKPKTTKRGDGEVEGKRPSEAEEEARKRRRTETRSDGDGGSTDAGGKRIEERSTVSSAEEADRRASESGNVRVETDDRAAVPMQGDGVGEAGGRSSSERRVVAVTPRLSVADIDPLVKGKGAVGEVACTPLSGQMGEPVSVPEAGVEISHGGDDGRLSNEPSKGMIWNTPFPGEDPDSFAAYLPYLTAGSRSKERTPAWDLLAQEAADLLCPDFLKAEFDADHGATLDKAAGHLMYAACCISRARGKSNKRSSRDEIKKATVARKAGLQSQYKEFLSRNVEVAVKAVEAERDNKNVELQDALARIREMESALANKEIDIAGLCGSLEDAKSESSLLAEKISKLEGERKSLEMNNKDLSLVVTKMKTDATSAKGEVQQVREELSRVKDKMESFLARFLESRAFRHAATICMRDVMAACLYNELQTVSEHYPFTPEQFGFKAPDEDAEAVVLSMKGYTWNEEEDKLVDPAGRDPPEELPLVDNDGVALPHVWRNVAPWPKNINEPNPNYLFYRDDGIVLGGEKTPSDKSTKSASSGYTPTSAESSDSKDSDQTVINHGDGKKGDAAEGTSISGNIC